MYQHWRRKEKLSPWFVQQLILYQHWRKSSVFVLFSSWHCTTNHRRGHFHWRVFRSGRALGLGDCHLCKCKKPETIWKLLDRKQVKRTRRPTRMLLAFMKKQETYECLQMSINFLMSLSTKDFLIVHGSRCINKQIRYFFTCLQGRVVCDKR